MATTYQPKGIGELTQKVILDGSEQVLIADGFQAKRASISDVLAGAGLSQSDRTKLNSAVTAAQLNTAVDAAKTQLEQSITSGLANKANASDLNQKADVSALTAYATTETVSDLVKKVNQKADATALTPLATTQELNTLATTVANKIDATALTPYATKAYVDQKVGTAFDPSVLEPLATKEALEELKTVVAGKAAKTDLTSLATKGELQTLSTTVSGKADKSALTELATKRDVDNVSQQLRQKVDVATLTAYATTGALATIQTALDAKADAATLNSAIQNITTLQQVQATKANTSDLAALATKDDVNLADERIKADLAKKVDAEEGKGLSTNDFTNALKAKLENMASGAGGSASLDDVKATVESEVKKSIGALNLDTRFSGKADVTELANYVTTTDFNGYKTEVAAALGEKATTIQVNAAVAGLISETSADGKYVLKADLAALKTEVEGKATAADIATALAPYATTKALTDGLVTKAESSALTSLATKEELSGLRTIVEEKADASELDDYETTAEVDRKLGLKADASSLANYETKTDLTTRLAGYATKEDIKGIATDGAIKSIQTELEKKATKAELTELATKQEVQNLSGVVSGKADATALTGLATKEDLKAKADVSALSSLATKADKSALSRYALKTEVPAAVDTSTFATKTELTGYVQKEAGKVLSSNDYTNAHKAAVDGIVGKTFLSAEANTNEYNLHGYRLTNLVAPVRAEQAANKEYVDTAINGLSSTYVLRESGKGLSTNDFTAALKSKLETINTANLMGLVGPTGAWDARTKVVDNVADPTAPAHAANKRYVDSAVGKIDLSGYVQKEAGKGLSEVNFTNAILNDHNTVVAALRNRVVMSRSTVNGSPFDAENRNIERVLAPTLDLHAANKAYVDTAISGLNLGRYVLKEGNKGLSENDFTTEYRNQLTTLNNYFGGMVVLRRAASATAAFDADGRRITGLAAPTAPTDAATKAYVDSAVGTGLTKASVGANIGLWDAKSLRIVNVPTPSQATDAANKAYVDGKINFSGTPLTYSSSTVVTQSGGISGLVKNVTDGVRFQGATLADTNDGHTVNDNVVLTAGRLRDVFSPVAAVGSTTAATFATAGALRVTKTIDATGQEIRGNLVIDSAVNNRKGNTDPVSYAVFNGYFVQGGNDLHMPRHTYFRANAGLASGNSRYNKDTGYGFISSETNPAMSNKNLFTAFQDIPPLVRWMFSAFGFKSINATPTADRTDNKQGTVGGGFWNTPPGGSISGFQLPSWLGGWAVFGGHISNVPTGLLVDIAWPVSGVTSSWCVMNAFAGHANYFATVHPSKFMRFILKNAYNSGEASQRISVFFLAVVKAST